MRSVVQPYSFVMNGLSDPIVTVIVPVHNGQKTIRQTLNSVCGQRFRNFECIIVDDGSSDGTAAIAEQFCKSDNRFRLLRQSNQGVANARNAALAKAKGEFIAPLDADDLWHPEFLERHLAVHRMGKGGIGFTYCHARTVDAAGFVTGCVAPHALSGKIANALRYYNACGNPSRTVARHDAMLLVGGYDPRLRAKGSEGSEDWLLIMKIAARFEVAVIPEYLVGYRVHSQSMSADRLAMVRSFELAEQFYAAESPHALLPIHVLQWQRSVRSLHQAKSDILRGRILAGLANMVKATRLDFVRTAAIAVDFLCYGLAKLRNQQRQHFRSLDPSAHHRQFTAERPLMFFVTDKRLRGLCRAAYES